MSEKEFARVILQWFEQHKRPLPWRETRDPYLIWLSEVILQQTRVAQGLSYYHEFANNFPTVDALAKAKEVQVLRIWEGLGYYSRARNLLRCAQLIVKENRSCFPNTFVGLNELPGVGPYTAAAIASIAFDERVAVLDGNVFRVMARIFGIDTDITSPQARKLFFEHTMRFVPASKPGDFNQALMEFGALQCVPRNPDCESCPFSKVCVAFRSGTVDLLPVKKKKAKTRRRFLNYFVLESGGKIGLKRRNGQDIWKGLYDFYLVETASEVKPASIMRGDKMLRSLAVKSPVEVVRLDHQLTHQKLHISFIGVVAKKENLTNLTTVAEPIAFYSMKQAASLPKPVPVKLFLEQLKKGRKGN